ncbi:MAG: PKD domain-containing protein [Ferruginibacter sp.]|nr:PKD domain-containing protein [Ferruginibacter sp.]
MMRSPINSFLVFSLIMISGSYCYGQNLSNRGRDFWVGYGHHQFMEVGQSNSQQMVLYFSAEQAANVTVTIHGTAYIRNYAVPANSVIVSEVIPKSGTYDARLITLGCTFVPDPTTDACGGEGAFANKAIHIESDVPIVAYAHIYGQASSGATMLMPVTTWGYSYITLNSLQSYAANCFSWAYVIAQHDNTVVEITPSATTRRGRPANVPFTITLNRGEIYQTMAGPEGGTSKSEFSGTKFKSIANASGECFPVAVFAGSSRTSGSGNCSSGTGDNDNQQCFPSQAWGKRYLLAPTSSSTGASTFMSNAYKIAVKNAATQVWRNGVLLTGINPAGYYEFFSNQPEYIVSDEPVMVAQFMKGGACLNGPLGDPEMIYVSPVEQGTNRIGFYRNTEENISVNYLTMIIPTGGIPSLRIDGSPTFDYSYAHPRLAGYSVVIKRWPAAKAQCIVTSDSAFTAITYGLGSVESYGYNAGTLINNLNGVADIHNILDPTRPSHNYTCINTPVELSMLMAYEPTKMVWKLSEFGSVLTPNADVTDNAPVSNGTRVIEGVTYFRYSLPGVYQFNTAGTYYVHVDCTNPAVDNCTNTEELNFIVEVRDGPKVDFSFSHSGCVMDSMVLSSPDSSANGFDIVKYNWTLTGGITATGQNPSVLFPTPGTKSIQLEVISDEGCRNDSTINNILVSGRPVNSIVATPNAFCSGQSTTITPTANFGGPGSIQEWYWDFGSGSFAAVGNGNAQTISFNNSGSQTIRFTTAVSTTCPGDTASLSLTVRAQPVASFTYPAGCLPTTGSVQFTNTSSTPDGRAINSYAWNFGDANATPANPNTSTAQNPTHFYSVVGNYDVQLSVTTVDGCTKDTTVHANFNLTPLLSYPTLSPVCIDGGSVSVATASVTNAVPGSGVYSGNGTAADGTFNPLAAGPGTHSITYTYTTAANCVESISQNILVRDKPHVNFAVANPVACLPINGGVTFDNTTTISDGQTITWNWNFNDPNAGTGNLNTSSAFEPSHNFREGNYDIKLLATTNNGCVHDSTIRFTFGVKPAVVYSALADICENGATTSIALGTVSNSVTGSSLYIGAGTSSAGMLTPPLAGAGTHPIKFIFTTNGGCKDSVTQSIRIWAKPRIGFSANTGCLGTNGLATFVNSSSVPDGQTLTYAWNFNDPNAGASNPNTSTLIAPTHSFKEGTYQILLNATTNKGCTHDSTITMTFGVKPAISFPAPSSVCAHETTPVSVATATITNGVTGAGVYMGSGISNSGMVVPAIAGAGNLPIKYIFTTSGGCIDSASTSILINPKPVPNINVTADICEGQNAVMTDNSTIAAGNTIAQWHWFFGNGRDTVRTVRTSFNEGYYQYGNYPVRMVAISNKGCISDTTQAVVNVHALPLVAFDIPQFVCMPDGSASFTNHTTIPDGASLTWQWNFGDGGPIVPAESPTHLYATSNPVDVKLTATSSFGCVASLIKTLNVFYDQPIASFSVTPTSLCHGTPNVLIDNSTAPNSSIRSWEWNFGDGEISHLPNPRKVYLLPGNYTIKLTVKNEFGCASDPVQENVTVYYQPHVDAGPEIIVPFNSLVTLNPITSDTIHVSFLWTPQGEIINPTVLRPTFIATRNEFYTITITGAGNCTASDIVGVHILHPVKVPNAFSPNGDGINDTWQIDDLDDYPGVTVDVFNRYGQSVFSSVGYAKFWDGTYKGKPLPLATYYYVIHLKNGFPPLKGSVTIVK